MLTTTTTTYAFHDHDIISGEDSDKPYILRFKDMADEDKPREKLSLVGARNLTVAELLAIVWSVGTKKEDVLSMAKRTLQEYGEKAIINEQNPARLAEAADIPINKAYQLVASFELGRRFHATGRTGRPEQVRTLRQAHVYLKDIGNSKKEQLRALYLNSRYQVIHDEVISVGSLTSNIVHPREVFQPAIEYGAVAVIIAHNHPSGVLKPSKADITITRQLMVVGEVLGIDLLDHLIITAKQHASIMEHIQK